MFGRARVRLCPHPDIRRLELSCKSSVGMSERTGDPYMNHCASTAPAYIGMASNDLTIGMAKIEQSVKNWQEVNSSKYK
eukprot:5003955-Amphidinium_carterae.1